MLKLKKNMKVTEKHVFFYGGILSNWANVGKIIPVDGKKFSTSEHAFMYLKAKFFEDEEIAEDIAKCTTPKVAKELGRAVRGFDPTEWDKHKKEIMQTAVTAKLISKKFYDTLMDPKYNGKTFVEASPVDCIWGIGMGEDNPCVDDESKWRGENLLGQVLTELRNSLLKK